LRRRPEAVEMMLNLDTSIVRSDQAVYTEFEAEVVAMNPDKGHCYGFNKVGSRIWQLAAAPVPIHEICAKLSSEYNVESETCNKQVIDFLEGLRLEELVNVVARAESTDH